VKEADPDASAITFHNHQYKQHGDDYMCVCVCMIEGGVRTYTCHILKVRGDVASADTCGLTVKFLLLLKAMACCMMLDVVHAAEEVKAA
jgi:hypothetical protein